MSRILPSSLGVLAILCFAGTAFAVTSAEVYTTKAYGYGRFEARVRFAPGEGVVSSFFMWKDGSEKAGTFWNELDFEKLNGECRVETNAIFGNPSANHSQRHSLGADLCTAFHTYAYEWTPDTIVYLMDGVEIRRDTGATATAFAQNAAGGMQLHFNLWPGDASFGGNFNPSILPVHEYIDWVQFSTYANGQFTLAWREDFDAGTLPSGWVTGNWASPKNLSTHDPRNVNLIRGYLVLSLTADNAVGPAGAMPEASAGTGGSGAGGTTGAGGKANSGGGGAANAGKGGATNGGATNGGATNGGATNGGTTNGGTTNGGAGKGGATSAGAASGGTASGGTAGESSGASAGARAGAGGAATLGGAGPVSSGGAAFSAGGSTASAGAQATSGGATAASGAASQGSGSTSGGCSFTPRGSSTALGALALVAISAFGRRSRRRARSSAN